MTDPSAPIKPDFRIQIQKPNGEIEIFYEPLPHQLAFHVSNAPNLLMEGGRDSGKSLCMRRDAQFRCLAFPGFRALILRREMPELRKTHLAAIEGEMKKLGGYFHKTESVAYFAPAGPDGLISTITFGHCEDDAAILNFLSAEFDAIYFDELSTFTLRMFLQISASARCPESSGRIAIVRAGTNPLGIGADWVKQWFIDRNVDVAEHQGYHPDDFQAIHSTVDDNPYADREAYKKRLSALPDHIRRAWLLGEWITEGAYFSDFQPARLLDGDTRPWHVIPELPTVKGQPLLSQPWINIYRAYDHGWSPDYAYCLWVAVLPNGIAIAFKEKAWLKTTAADIAKDIVRESEGMRIVETLCDPSVFVNQQSTGSSVGDVIEQNGVPLTASVNDRAAAGLAIHEWLSTQIGPQPKLQMLREGCPRLIRTLPQMRMDPREPMRLAPGGEDHPVITLAYFCMGSIAPSHEPAAANTLLLKYLPRRKPLGSANVRAAA